MKNYLEHNLTQNIGINARKNLIINELPKNHYDVNMILSNKSPHKNLKSINNDNSLLYNIKPIYDYKNQVIYHNNKRLIEVWLDKYKDFIYAIMPGLCLIF